MVNISKGTQGEFEQIRDFANYVFSQSSHPHDFRRLLPKVYDNRYRRPHYMQV